MPAGVCGDLGVGIGRPAGAAGNREILRAVSVAVKKGRGGMKLSKYVGLVKRGGYCVVNHVENSGIWLGTREAVYRATELPDMVGEEQVGAVLDIDEKAWGKIYLRETESPGIHDVFGMDLTENTSDEQNAKETQMQVNYKGYAATALICDDGELIFYDKGLAAPLADAMKNSDYIQTVVRRTRSGQRFVVIKDGLEVLAGIMPVQIVNQQFLADLAEFESVCVGQFMREKNRAAWEPASGAVDVEPEDDGQTSMEDADGE